MIFWAGSFSFISAKISDLGVKKNRLDERVFLNIQPQVLVVFSQS